MRASHIPILSASIKIVCVSYSLSKCTRSFSLNPRAHCWISSRSCCCLWWRVKLAPHPPRSTTMSKNSSIQLWLVLPPLDATANNGPSAILVTVLCPLSWSNSVVRCQCLCSKAGHLSSHQSHRAVVPFVPLLHCVFVFECLFSVCFHLISLRAQLVIWRVGGSGPEENVKLNYLWYLCEWSL